MSRFLLTFFSVLFLGQSPPPLVWAEESDGAEVMLLKNRYYPHKILKLIRDSKESVRLCLVVCDYTGDRADFSTRLIQELASQAKHGVLVEVILEGGKGNLGKANAKASQYLYDNGVTVYEDSETEFTRSNMLIVDQFTAVVGSTVWAKKIFEPVQRTEFMD